MNTFSIQLNTPKDVYDFVAAASSCPKDIGLSVSHEKYEVDARSLMGIFSLNLSEPVTVKMSGETNLINTYSKVFDKWSVEE